MTSMPASRSARAMIFAPRSWPSRPGLATTTRILRLPCAVAAGFSAVPSMARSLGDGRRDAVTNPHRPAGEDVGAQPAAVDERPEDPPAVEAIEVRARLAQAAASAAHLADHELAPHERVQIGSADDHV